MRYDWMWLRVPLDGVFRTMIERNVNTQCGATVMYTEGISQGFVKAAPNAASGRRLAKLLETGG
ncbi:MAG: hypothetical protein IPL84_05410 [Chitinophagaceae bacterium]|nr:hypothetical protein [Chitinophagaceae bacterium]